MNLHDARGRDRRGELNDQETIVDGALAEAEPVTTSAKAFTFAVADTM